MSAKTTHVVFITTAISVPLLGWLANLKIQIPDYRNKWLFQAYKYTERTEGSSSFEGPKSTENKKSLYLNRACFQSYAQTSPFFRL